MFLYLSIMIYVDIDECAAGIHNCSQNQECINDPGGYHCLCITGYELLNGTCEGNHRLVNCT